MKITVTEKHLNKAIRERANGCITESCVMAQAILPKVPKATAVAWGGVYERKDGTDVKIFTYPAEIYCSIEEEFDNSNYNKIRSILPVTFELTPA